MHLSHYLIIIITSFVVLLAEQARRILELLSTHVGDGLTERLWTDEQLGLLNGSAPSTLVDSTHTPVVGEEALLVAKARLAHLLPRDAGTQLELEYEAAAARNKAVDGDTNKAEFLDVMAAKQVKRTVPLDQPVELFARKTRRAASAQA